MHKRILSDKNHFGRICFSSRSVNPWPRPYSSARLALLCHPKQIHLKNQLECWKRSTMKEASTCFTVRQSLITLSVVAQVDMSCFGTHTNKESQMSILFDNCSMKLDLLLRDLRAPLLWSSFHRWSVSLVGVELPSAFGSEQKASLPSNEMSLSLSHL